MKTYNLDIELLTPLQINKEVLINEALMTIDNLTNLIIVDFIATIPSEAIVGKKYILSEGDGINHIVHCSHLSKGWQIFIPRQHTIVFIIAKNSFYLFNESWKKIELSTNTDVASFKSFELELNNLKFISIGKKYDYNKSQKIQYLYLDDNCEINFEKNDFQELTLVIKQNYKNTFQITWPSMVLWPNKIAPKISQIINALDIFKFYRLPETQHFIGEIIGQNYKY